ncbi:zonular occludens toxin domain-containing protein [Sphingobium sp.]|uniref:zonular occludens toxin domain-containing protein n=1 Tax=Sphingobium sp. TaxID=1912891 RepID=UPI0028BD18DE|nr:zonular occludens toxin domain-containing protein [Sphingobium sp.]
MALSLYLGPPGSGKTYEAIRSVAIPAYRDGRHIITNIKGVTPDHWEANIEPNKGKKCGSITVVDDEFFQDEKSYPLMTKDKAIAPGLIPNGALVIIDEAYNIFPPSPKEAVTKRMIEWVRTHRHFVSDDGIASDVVLISQDVMSIHPRVRSVGEFFTAIRNLRFLGISTRYRITVFTSWRMNAASKLGQTFRRYDVSIFSYYKSFQTEGTAKVVLTDSSQKAIKWWHYVFVGACAVGIVWGGLRTSEKVFGTDVSIKDASAVSMLKPDCAGSGILFDLTTRKALVHGEWRDATIAPLSLDGRVGWDVGPCIFRFSKPNVGR